MTRLVLLLAAALVAPNARAQDACVTPSRKNGSCINISNCPPLVEILRRQRPIPAASLELLRNSQCGFDGMFPKVCCEIQQAEVATTTEAAGSGLPVSDEVSDPAGVPQPPDVGEHPNLRLLDHARCGPLSQRKIIGGNKTRVFDFPWMALIAYDTGRPVPEFRCGGSIINTKYILTAAHCVTALPAGLRVRGVRIGEHDLSTERDCDKDEEGLEVVCAERYQDFGVESIHFHPEYTQARLQNDIALIRINGQADFRPQSVRPICLPIGTAATLAQKKVTVTGWGATELGPRSRDLLMVLLSPVPTEQCAEIYRRSVSIWYKQMCAGGNKSMDSCLGDSGGPLQAPALYRNNLRYVQYGIVSYGLRNCGTEGYPGVYTRLVYYLDWILDTIRP